MSETQPHPEAITNGPHEAHPALTGAHAPHALPFTDAEWQTLQDSDLAAARAVVSLLLGVFCIGVVLYSIVCWAVSS